MSEQQTIILWAVTEYNRDRGQGTPVIRALCDSLEEADRYEEEETYNPDLEKTMVTVSKSAAEKIVALANEEDDDGTP